MCKKANVGKIHTIKFRANRVISLLTVSIYYQWRSHEAWKPLKKSIVCKKWLKRHPKPVEPCKDRLNEPDISDSCVYESLILIGWRMGRLLREEMYIFILSIEKCAPAKWLYARLLQPRLARCSRQAKKTHRFD